MSEFNYPTAGLTSGSAINELLSDRTVNDIRYENLSLSGSKDSTIVEGLTASQGLQRISMALYWPGGTLETPGSFMETVPYGLATPEERLAIAEKTYRLIIAAGVGRALLDSLPLDPVHKRYPDRTGLETAIDICRQKFLPLAVFDVNAVSHRESNEPNGKHTVELWHPHFTDAAPVLRHIKTEVLRQPLD